MGEIKHPKFLGLLRILMGWIFLWPFLDKVFGLGFATEAGKGWIDGGSPTAGFLKFGTHGPFSAFYQSMAGNSFVDWMFMLGLLLIGLALIMGVMMRVATFGAVLLLLMMWSSLLPPEHNPIIDEHIIYAVTLIVLNMASAGRYIGFGDEWEKTDLVQKNKFLK